MSAKPTERNHYLPQFYLKSFLSNKIFWVYYKDGSGPIAQTPINTGVEKNLYTFKNPNGSKNDELERILGIAENNATEIIKNLSKPNARLDANDISDLAIFFSFMATRVPNAINLAKELGEEIIRTKLIKFSKNLKEIQRVIDEVNSKEPRAINLSPEEIQKAFSSPEEHFKFSLKKTLPMAISINQAVKLYYTFCQMNWCLYRAPSNIQFITSDSPVVPFIRYRDGSATIGTGYGMKDVEVSIPISPHLCIIMSHKPRQKYIAASKKFVLKVNRRTAWNGEIFLISSNKTKYVSGLTDWASRSKDFPKINRKAVRRDFA